MKKLSLPLAVLALCLALPSFAKERAGVQAADTVTVEGKTLKLNGLGLRTKAIFKVYVLALYLETPSKNPQAIIQSDQIKRVQMVLLRSVDKAKIVDAIREGFSRNNQAQLPALKSRLDTLANVIPDLKEGNQLVFTYVPGKGTLVQAPGGKTATLEGKDFADALFSTWLGKIPADEDLRDELLGG